MAVLVGGAPGSGKSTLGRALAGRCGAALLDLDSVAGPLTAVLAEVVGADDLDAPAWGGRLRAARYGGLLAAGEDCLRAGVPVVLVAPFSAERAGRTAWAATRDRLARAGGIPRLVWPRVDGDELVRRLRARGAGRDAAKVGDPATFLARHDTGPPRVPHLAVDGAAPLDEQVARVLEELGRCAGRAGSPPTP